MIRAALPAFFGGALFTSSCAEHGKEEDESESPSSSEDVAQSTDELKMCVPQCGVSGISCGHVDDGCDGTAWCGTCACPSTFRACEVDLPTIYEVPVTLTANVPFSVWTSGLSAGADSVIHLIDTVTGTQLAMNDNVGASLASSLTYTSPQTRNAIVVVRAKSATTQGTATFNTGIGSLPITLGAYEQIVSSPRLADVYETVRLPTDPGTMHVAYVMQGESIASRYVGGGIGGAVSFSLGTSIQAKRLILGQSNLSFSVGTSPPGRIRLVRNDRAVAGHDPDNDGLGSELEAALGTCSTLSGTATGADGVVFDCATAADPKDTDGDGLQDAWEALGKRNAAGDLPLPWWGARARRKDIFVEADFGLQDVGEAPQHVSGATVDSMVSLYADRKDALTAAQRAAHAAMVKNPDGSIGLRLHVDNGLVPPANEATFYGNWGGYSVVPPASPGHPQAAGNAMTTFMSAARTGVFKYWLASVGGGGQTFPNAPFFNSGFSDGPTAAHELGHGFGLAHSGVAPAGATVDPNCKPNYPSLMNYAFLGVTGFSDGAGAPMLNNAAAIESNVADPATMQPFLANLETEYSYKVDKVAGHVDWNRDGVFAPGGTTVRAYINSKTATSCEHTRYNSTVLTSFTTPLGPALTRYQGRVIVLYAGTTSLRYAVSSALPACTTTNTTPCGAFDTTGSLPLDTSLGVDAVHMMSPEGTVIVARGADNTLRAVNIIGMTGPNTPQFGPVTVLSGTPAAGEPALTEDLNGGALLVYRDAAGAVYQRSYTNLGATGVFSNEAAVLDQNGVQMMMSSTKSSPGIGVANVPLTGLAASPRMYGVFADSSNVFRLFYRDVDGRWKPRAAQSLEMTGRPQIEWIADAADQAIGGRMMIAFSSREWGNSDPELRNIYVLRSYVDKAVPGQIQIGTWQGYDSDWTVSYGIHLLYEAGVDTNVRAAWTHSLAFPESGVVQQVLFNPKADGINNYLYGPISDWHVMQVNICRNIGAGNGVTCPPQDW